MCEMKGKWISECLRVGECLYVYVTLCYMCMKWNYLCEPKSSSFTFLLVIFSNAHRKSKSIQARWMQANTEEEKNIVMQMNKWEYANWINFKWIVEPKDLKHIAYKYVQNKQFEAVAFGWNVKKVAENDWWNDDAMMIMMMMIRYYDSRQHWITFVWDPRSREKDEFTGS